MMMGRGGPCLGPPHQDGRRGFWVGIKYALVETSLGLHIHIWSPSVMSNISARIVSQFILRSFAQRKAARPPKFCHFERVRAAFLTSRGYGWAPP